MSQVLITASTLADMDGAFRHILRDAGFAVHHPAKRTQLSEADLLRELPGFPAVLAGSETYSDRVFAHCPELKVIARVGVGYDAVDITAASRHGVAVTITPGANHDCVAEHAFSLILALAKSVVVTNGDLKRGVWRRTTTVPLRGRTLGIVGLGRIGRAVAIRAKAFQMKLIAHEPLPDMAFVAAQGIQLTTFEGLLAASDYVTLHAPMTAETKGMVNRGSLALMKPTAFLINTARGGLIDEADLFEALRSKRVAGAGLDVFDQEPPGLIPLLSLDNVVATPHLAGIDHQSALDMALMAAESIVALSRGQWPGHQIVNPEVKAAFQWPE